LLTHLNEVFIGKNSKHRISGQKVEFVNMSLFAHLFFIKVARASLDRSLLIDTNGQIVVPLHADGIGHLYSIVAFSVLRQYDVCTRGIFGSSPSIKSFVMASSLSPPGQYPPVGHGLHVSGLNDPS
jgi:hypothetical protein